MRQRKLWRNFWASSTEVLAAENQARPSVVFHTTSEATTAKRPFLNSRPSPHARFIRPCLPTTLIYTAAWRHRGQDLMLRASLTHTYHSILQRCLDTKAFTAVVKWDTISCNKQNFAMWNIVFEGQKVFSFHKTIDLTIQTKGSWEINQRQDNWYLLKIP